MTPETLAVLRSVDTPTVCNAIEVAQGKRGFSEFTRGTFVATAPSAGAMVGYARTLKIAGAQPPMEPADEIKSRRMAAYRYMAEAPMPAVAVVEDADHPSCIGAYWGEINAAVHRGFGLSGVLTNGVVRDLGDLPMDFPILAGSVGVSHGFVHVMEIGTGVSVHGLDVQPGNLIHADQHGAVIIPSDIVDSMAAAIAHLHTTESIVLDAAGSPGFDFEAFEIAWQKFEDARV